LGERTNQTKNIFRASFYWFFTTTHYQLSR
jgi:hypothetical protein